ncbi:hypothetical protein H1C71_016913, partial [Ictidomys tridecemlineatus]
ETEYTKRGEKKKKGKCRGPNLDNIREIQTRLQESGRTAGLALHSSGQLLMPSARCFSRLDAANALITSCSRKKAWCPWTTISVSSCQEVLFLNNNSQLLVVLLVSL